MRCLSSAVLSVLVLALGSSAAADHHKKDGGKEMAWIDTQKCAICKTMAENKELMKSVEMETHKIDNGLMMVARAPESMVDEFRMACKKMEKAAMKVTNGEMPDAKCCGFCKSMGKLMESGAKVQKVKTDTGQITLITSDKPQTVSMIHDHAEKTKMAMKKKQTASR